MTSGMMSAPVAQHETPSPGGRGGRARWAFAGPAVALLGMLVALLVAGGAPEPVAAGLPDPGPVTAWGLPLSRLVFDLAFVVVIGSLVTAALLPAEEFTDTAAAALLAAGWGAAVWALSAAALLLFTVSDVLGVPPLRVFSTDPGYALEFTAGRGLLLVVGCGIVLASYSRWTQTRAGVAALLALAVAALLPVLFAGHSSAASDHDLATSSLIVHVVGASVWVGGLAGVLLLLRRRPRTLADVLPRYSMLALVCFGAVAFSGLLNAWVRTSGDLGLWAGSGYGALLMVKVAGLVALGCFGYWHRLRTIDGLTAGRPRAFARLASVEVLVMAATVGVAVALSRTPPPAGATADVPTHGLGHPTLGDDVEPFSLTRFVTEWRPEAIWLLIVVVMFGCYLAGLRRLRRDGVAWPWSRPAAAAGAAVVALLATSGGLATYSTATFSLQVVQFLTLLIVVPTLVTLSAPATMLALVLRPAQQTAARSAEAVPALPTSRVTAWLLDPLNMLIVVTVTVFALYATPLLEASLRSAPLHLAVNVFTLAVGCVLWSSMLGVDGVLPRRPRGYRMWVLFGFVVLLGGIAVRIYLSDVILAGNWFADLDWAWVELSTDQRLGALLMGVGVVTLGPLLAALIGRRRTPAQG
ncbi:MAG TPA: bifunctional copper resistance protein CopD/cytochrome c oxidase assembly protein [Nocardioidaceae bacterium]|nr:bifunctional copper resistance protein CopD/cytochrome c oxidase assembly protein [Nocardioidaceae bacterium]